jgi:hypothetical protein
MADRARKVQGGGVNADYFVHPHHQLGAFQEISEVVSPHA